MAEGAAVANAISAAALLAGRVLIPAPLAPDLAGDTKLPTSAPSRPLPIAHHGPGAAASAGLPARRIVHSVPLAPDIARGREAPSVHNTVPPTEEGEVILVPSQRPSHHCRGAAPFDSAAGHIAGPFLRLAPLALEPTRGREGPGPMTEEGEFVLDPSSRSSPHGFGASAAIACPYRRRSAPAGRTLRLAGTSTSRS